MGRRGRVPYTYIPPVEEYYHNSPYKLEIRKSQIIEAGNGVYAMEAIPSNVRVDIYTGDEMNHGYASPYYLSVSDNYGIDAQSFPRCYMAMINDAHGSEFQNNCEIRINGRVPEIWTIADIPACTELMMSYGPDYWSK